VATLVALALGLGAEAGVFAPYLVVVVAIGLWYGTGPAVVAALAAMLAAYWWLLAPVMMLVADIAGVRRLAVFRLAVFGTAAAAMLACIRRHRRVLADLERTRRQLLAFLASERIGLQAIEHDGRIVWEDPTAAALTGDGARDHVGGHLSGVLADPAVADSVLRRLARGEPVENLRAQVRCADGRTRDVLLNSNELLGNAREPGNAVLLALMPLDGGRDDGAREPKSTS
jgi:PAS domain-containing protein